MLKASQFADVVANIEAPRGKYAVSIVDPARDKLDKLVASGSESLPPGPPKPGRIVLPTSGTTGTPQGAPRSEPGRRPGGLGEHHAFLTQPQLVFRALVLSQRADLLEAGVEHQDRLHPDRHVAHHPPTGTPIGPPRLLGHR